MLKCLMVNLVQSGKKRSPHENKCSSDAFEEVDQLSRGKMCYMRICPEKVLQLSMAKIWTKKYRSTICNTEEQLLRYLSLDVCDYFCLHLLFNLRPEKTC